MQIDKLCIEYFHNKLCLVVYNEDSTKDIYIINNENKVKLYDLLLDIIIFSKNMIIKR